MWSFSLRLLSSIQIKLEKRENKRCANIVHFKVRKSHKYLFFTKCFDSGVGKMEVSVKKVATLKKNYEFSRVFNKGLFYVGRHIVVYAFPNRQSIKRIGISVSKKAGKAVLRNKKKRLIREVYKHYEEFILNGYDIVIAARGGETVFKYSDLLKEFKYLLKKLQIFDQEKHNCLKEL